MIGSNTNPLSMFTGQSPNGPSMYQIGYQGGPGGGINAALNATIDRYHANLDAQSEQSNKMAQIQATGNAGLGKEKALIDYKNAHAAPDPDAAGPFTQVDPKTGKYFVRSTSINPTTGQPSVGWSPVSPSAPEKPMQQLEDMTVQPILDKMRVDQNPIQQSASVTPVSPIPGVPPAAIQQTTSGSVVNSVGQQTGLPRGVTENEIQYTLSLHPEYTRESLLKKLGA